MLKIFYHCTQNLIVIPNNTKIHRVFHLTFKVTSFLAKPEAIKNCKLRKIMTNNEYIKHLKFYLSILITKKITEILLL